MPSLFNNYCYPTQQAAADAELSAPALVSDAGIVTAKSYTSINNTDAYVVYRYSPLNGSAPFEVTTVRTYAECQQVGYLTNFSGITLQDATITAWGVALVWIAAWSIKVLRQGARS